MSVMVMARLGALGLLLLAGCSSGGNTALRQSCSVVDGGGTVYQVTNPEMLDALEQAMQACETAATDPATCVAKGCGGTR